jgi:hypothetical protein
MNRCRVKYAVQTLNLFSFLAFPFSVPSKTGPKWAGFGDELVDEFCVSRKRSLSVIEESQVASPEL